LKHSSEVEGLDWCEVVIDSNTDPFMLLVLLDKLETMAGFDVMTPSTNIIRIRKRTRRNIRKNYQHHTPQKPLF